MSPTLLLVLGLGAVFASILLALSVIGVATTEKRGVSRSLSAIKAMQSAPAAMRKEIEPPFSERVIEPLTRRLVRIGRRITPHDSAQRIRHRLDVAGNPAGWDVDRVVATKVLALCAFFAVSLALCLLLGVSLGVALVLCVGSALFGYIAPTLWLYNLGERREESMRTELPDALDVLTISVEAGLAFDAAVARVARNTEGPLANEFARVLQEMQIGVGRVDAIRALGERTHLADLKGFVTAMIQADAFGIPIGQVLRVQSQEMRTKRRQRAEERAQKVPIKILIPLVFFILPALFIAVLGPAVIRIVEDFGGTL
jgi:tight adherence protein C